MKQSIAFLNSFSLPNKKWHAQGISKASPSKTDQVSAFKVLGFPSVKVSDVEPIWKAQGESFEIDKRVADHISVHCQYDHYAR